VTVFEYIEVGVLLWVGLFYIGIVDLFHSPVALALVCAWIAFDIGRRSKAK